METNTTGGNDSHVPRNRSGIVLRYSTTLRRVEVVFPPRLQSTCVAHDGIEDQSARTYITTIRQANTLRNFVNMCILRCKTCTAAVNLSRRGATWCATCPHAGGARTSVTCACQGSSVWYLIYRGRRLINIDDFITFCDAILVH